MSTYDITSSFCILPIINTKQLRGDWYGLIVACMLNQTYKFNCFQLHDNHLFIWHNIVFIDYAIKVF